MAPQQILAITPPLQPLLQRGLLLRDQIASRRGSAHNAAWRASFGLTGLADIASSGLIPPGDPGVAD